jgi:hypothetical protein
MMNGVTHFSAPPATDPFYASARPNQPIVLFRGHVDLIGTSSTERHRGGIVLDWLPSPTLRTWIRGAMSTLAIPAVLGGDGVIITPRTPGRAVPRQSRTSKGGPRKAATTFEAGSHLLNYECGDGGVALSYGLLHLANFPRFHGQPVGFPDGSVDYGRLLFEGGGWTITVDQVHNADELLKELKNDGGFALTHTARVKRTSGVTFTSAELQALTETFTYFCWLCTETRCGPMLPVGFDSQGDARWARWNPTRTESFTQPWTWLDSSIHAGEAETLFPMFMGRFADPYWRQVLTHAIAYLIEAGRPSTIERAIIMAQVLLEAMSYSWLVEERKLRTHDGFEAHTAAENIRAMLRDMKVPVTIPKSLPALATTRSKRGSPVDGPQALVLKRNEIIHRRRPAPVSTYDPLIEAWRLGAWYSELVVLRVCGFNGHYRSRLNDNVWAGVVDAVPWQ